MNTAVLKGKNDGVNVAVSFFVVVVMGILVRMVGGYSVFTDKCLFSDSVTNGVCHAVIYSNVRFSITNNIGENHTILLLCIVQFSLQTLNCTKVTEISLIIFNSFILQSKFE